MLALNGTDGAEVWRTVRAGQPSALLATRDAVYLGGHDAGASVVRLDPATGRELWATVVDGPAGYTGALALHASGDLLAAGMANASGRVFLTRLDPAVGRARWRRFRRAACVRADDEPSR